MSTLRELMNEWQWDPMTLGILVAASVAYFAVFKSSSRPTYFLAAIAVIAIALLSPLQAMAEGVLFSAHMTQHILLLLIAPALLLASLPARISGRFGFSSASVAIGWIGGVGSMWLWHAPTLCTAAVTVGWVHAVQTVSLVALGAAFWWPIFGPADDHRLSPAAGIAYLATACLACTALGIVLTLTPIQVCPIFRQPAPLGALGARIRSSITPEHDQQLGGLLMWVPMCLVYLSAIMLELSRWWRAPQTEQEARA
jgi:cytochrome c oxidase assembly factor CtaG